MERSFRESFTYCYKFTVIVHTSSSHFARFDSILISSVFIWIMLRSDHFDEDRFDRSRRTGWIDIDSINEKRCLVVGAGALGNEVVKNLVLSGFRDITVVDMDHVVRSNLNRCVFFRSSDVDGESKSDIVAKRASDLDGDVKIISKTMTIQEFDDWDFDIVLGCLDNVAARLHVNAHCMFHNIPYVDGATDGLRGKVQVVLDGTCLQCTMNSSHMKVMNERFSCTGQQHIFVRRLAAEITTTSVIAAMQVREAVKIMSGRKDMCIDNVTFYNGDTGEMFTLHGDIDPECPNHGVKEWE